jgi:hypothetical protein
LSLFSTSPAARARLFCAAQAFGLGEPALQAEERATGAKARAKRPGAKTQAFDLG